MLGHFLVRQAGLISHKKRECSRKSIEPSTVCFGHDSTFLGERPAFDQHRQIKIPVGQTFQRGLADFSPAGPE
jgi:hypothetical protein